jgi:antitoxin VapB
MGLNLKNAEVEKLATEVARLAGESKTEAVRVSLKERKERLKAHGALGSRSERLERFFSTQVWPNIPKRLLGKGVSKKEREKILGYGPDGV